MKLVDLLNLESAFASESCRLEVTDGGQITTVQLNSCSDPVTRELDHRCRDFKRRVVELIRVELEFELKDKLTELKGVPFEA